MLCLQLVNYFHIHDLPWFSQQSWKERRKEGRKEGQKAISFLVLQMKRCCFLRLTAGNLVGNRAGSPDVCQDCSHSEPKLSTGYMPQGRHSTQELQHRLSHFICTTANMLLGVGGERWEAKAPGIWIQQGCAAGKSPGQDLLQNQHSPSPSQLPVKPEICISFGSEFVMCQPDGCQGDMICSVTSSHVRMSYSEPDTPVHIVKAHCGVRGCGNK